MIFGVSNFVESKYRKDLSSTLSNFLQSDFHGKFKTEFFREKGFLWNISLLKDRINFRMSLSLTLHSSLEKEPLILSVCLVNSSQFIQNKFADPVHSVLELCTFILPENRRFQN
jgi:hypothetical protein